MKAVIMAGGEGTRLRPLTCDCPKPMARLCGRPVLDYILDNLAKSGVSEAALTLRYLPQVIKEHFPRPEYKGIRLSFFEEDRPLGTAGGVKNAVQENAGDGLLVLSGDALCDFDLSAAMRFHREKKAAATVVTTHVADPREYGLVVAEPTGRINGFVEKPGWAQSVTDSVNSGIYLLSPEVLEMIPSGKAFDFGKDLFPRILQSGLPLFAFDADGYWCDIGDIGAYVSCQFEMLEGRTECVLPGVREGGIYRNGELPPGNYTLSPPAYIGQGVRIGDYAQIGPFAVIDDGCSIGSGSTIRNSVVLQDAYIGERCELRGALVCPGASLKKRAGMFEGSVAGPGSMIGSDASVSPGVRIWPGKRVEDGARAAANIKVGSSRKGIFDDDGITGEVGADLTPEFCVRLGAAAAGAMASDIAIAHDGSRAGKALMGAVAAGAVSAGARVFDLGECFEAMFDYGITQLGLKGGIFARMAGVRAVLKLADQNGLPLGREKERKIESAFSTGEFRRCSPSDYGGQYGMSGIGAMYENQLIRLIPGGLSGMSVRVRSSNRAALSLMGSVLKQLGCAEGGIRIHLTASGGNVSFFEEEGGYLDAARALALGCTAAFERGEDVALPFDSPRMIDRIADRYQKKVLRYLSSPADGSDRQARELAAAQPWVRDGLMNALLILDHLKKKGITLKSFASSLPPFGLAVRAVPVGGNPGRLLQKLISLQSRKAEGPSEGVLIAKNGGEILVSPLKRGNGLRILAEASSMEAAGELCDVFEKQLHRDEILDSGQDKS